MCEKAVEDESESLEFVPDHLKTQEMCERVVENEPDTLKFVPDYLKAQWMSGRAIENKSYNLKFIPDCPKTQGMCDKAVRGNPYSLQHVPDWFVTRELVAMWYDDSEHSDDDEDIFFKWFYDYKKRKIKKALINEELMPTAWHPSRWWNWCVSEDERRDTEKLWA